MTDAGKEADLAAIKARLDTDFKRLLMSVSETTTTEDDLKAKLAAVAAQCEQDYAAADQINIADKSELNTIVVHAKAAHAAMLRAVAERDATQGFFRKWGAVNRATQACITLNSVQNLLHTLIEQAENKKLHT
jgi:hypothetical protein